MAENKDWNGNKNSIFKTLGASNHTDKERQNDDYYATEPAAAEWLIKLEEFNGEPIWECASGENHLADVFKGYGFTVRTSDIVKRTPKTEVLDFLTCENKWDGHIITNPPYKCYDSETQCFTKRGWLNYWDLKDEDVILTVNPYTNELEWSEINEIIIRDIFPEEKMFHFKKNHMDIMVTEGHRMFAHRKKVEKLATKENDLIKSEDIRSTHYIPRLGYKWKGEYVEDFILPGVNGFAYAQPTYKESIRIKMDVWLDFFGLWLADGCCRHTLNSQGNQRKSVYIKQSIKTAQRVREILDKLPFNYKESKPEFKNKKTPCINFVINNEQLWSYLKQFGKSQDKFIPNNIKDLCVEQINRFLDSYFFGDGSIYKTSENESAGRIFRTTSKKLVEDIQEMLLKTGYLSHISKTYAGYSSESGKNVWMICENRNSVYTGYTFPSNKNGCCEIKYEGKVWCVNLKKNGVFLLRRNGNEFFCGNCALEFVEKALDLVGDGKKVCMFLKVQFLEGKARKKLFETNPPRRIWVSSSRLLCAKNAKFDEMRAGGGSAVAYAWFVWEKGYKGETVVKWFN